MKENYSYDINLKLKKTLLRFPLFLIFIATPLIVLLSVFSITYFISYFFYYLKLIF